MPDHQTDRAQETTESDHLLKELQVQRLELERQNQELCQARAEVEAGLEKYYQLYDFAPVGYCTVDREGMVRESNLACALLMGVDRQRLLHRPIQDLVARDSLAALSLFLKRIFSEEQKATGELYPGWRGRNPAPLSGGDGV
jgi:PAS domain-containing protein